MRTILLLPLLILACAAFGQRGASAQSTPLSFDDIFAKDLPGSWPKQMAWSPDGSVLTYLMPDPKGEGRVLMAQPASEGEASPLFAESALGTGEDGEARSLSAYQWAPDSASVLIESDGNLYRFSVAESGVSSGELETLLGTGDVVAPAFSPDSQKIAFVRKNDLWLLDLSKKVASKTRERRLTHDGKENEIFNGVTDWVYWEEIWGRNSTGFWWAPDSERLAFYRFDDRQVDQYALLDSIPRYPSVEWQRYPKAGRTNPKVQLGILPIGRGKTVWLDTQSDEETYLARLHWIGKSGGVAVERLNRDQNRLDLLRCDTKSGACSTLVTEEWPTWINLANDTHFLEDGRFILGSARTSWRHLYLYGAEGNLIRPLTQGRWSVSGLDYVDEANGVAFFTAHSASGAGAAHRQVSKVDMASGTVNPLSSDRGWHSGLIAPNGKSWIHTVSSANQAPLVRHLSTDGKVLKTLPTGPEAPFDPASLPTWEFITLWSLDGTKLPGQIMKPEGFDPTKSYPAIMYHYGGPGSQVVANAWSTRGRALWHKLMAQRGYVILSVDNEASQFFGKNGEDSVHRRFGEVNLAAQKAGVEYLKTLKFVDPERIGLWGWSGGGTNTLYCLFNSPGTWKAGVAGAPVTDWYLYDTIWTERYLDHPEDNAEGYKESSPITHAAKLKDALLVVHGTADDNVHPQNTMVLSNAMVKAGVPFEQAIYPGQKHGFRGKSERHFYERMTEFFDRHLTPNQGEVED